MPTTIPYPTERTSKTRVSDHGRTERHIYEPGNGTRYVIDVTLWSSGPATISLDNFNTRAVTLCLDGGLLHWSYLWEKLGLTSEADIAAILAFIRDHLGREVAMPPGFADDGVTWQRS
jgi:hypothetical protein